MLNKIINNGANLQIVTVILHTITFFFMNIEFAKYQGAGNDFIIIDNRTYNLPYTAFNTYKHWCNRHFGIGADGLIFIDTLPNFDFNMVYFNADGFLGSMCGNGARCAVAFAFDKKIIEQNTTLFNATDGEHSAKLLPNNLVSLKMNNVNNIQQVANDYVLNTGSPHYVTFVKNINLVNVFEQGKAIRYSKQFKKNGINVNFVQKIGANKIAIATYERGVENETLACGTGVTAAAIAHTINLKNKPYKLHINAKGGKLMVNFTKNNLNYTNIWLTGPAKYVFSGYINFKQN